MGYKIFFDDEDQLVIFEWSGPITSEDRKRNREEIGKYCKEYGTKKVLIDIRKQESKTKTMELFDFGSTFGNSSMKGFKIAAVGRAKDKDFQFIATVAINRFQYMESFTNISEAKAWLKE